MEKSATTPAEFIESLPTDVRSDIEQLDTEISKVMSGHPKTMWEGKFWGGSDQNIIGYGDYTYRRSDGNIVEWFIVGLAPQKNSLSVYVNAADGDGYLVEQYADKLGKAKVGKASINFTSLDDINLDVLLKLIAKANLQMSQLET
jgi:hypothetical protein